MTDSQETNRTLSKAYDPKAVEGRWYEFWQERSYFGADANAQGESTHPQTGDVYCITIPPPNVTGSLHIGHALQHSVHDLLIRWHRMQGRLTLCVPGTDHASIAVHTVLEKQLAKEGLSRHDLGRDKFLERAWAWKEHYGGLILQQMQLLGCSYDWRRERFTMDDRYSVAVQRVFVEWYRKGWIYRSYRIVNWCPSCQTSLSDLEAPIVDQPGSLWHIRYPLVGGNGEGVDVATTRPETMLGDTAVAVHPEDERYRALIGRKVILPFMERELPIVADDFVDPSFGTGAVKVTPAHDANDYEIGRRHNLPQVVVIDKNARMTEATNQYAGMDRYECREAVVRDLMERGLLVKTEDYPDAKVPRCARCDTVLEPLSLEQWFVDMKPLSAKAIEVIESQGVRYIPERYTHIALEWLRNIRDWNISRQLWWGQRIPAWRCADCEQWTVQIEPPSRCDQCNSESIEQDPDVFDTWFSSGIWPQAVLGWPDPSPELGKFFPTSLLITARDILHLWVARMIMSSLEFLDQVPFHDVYVHPTILTWEGKRMSKSLGTGVDPLELIEAYGADATRFGLLYMCSITQDVRFTEERVEMARNFCNKLWNASRFVLMNLEGADPLRVQCDPGGSESGVDDLSLADRWILSRLNRTIRKTNEALSNYNFDIAARGIYDFIWGDFCDWYIEMSKARLQGEQRPTTQAVLYHVLETALRLAHPFMPFITEEIWQSLPNGKARATDSLMVARYPQANESTWTRSESGIDESAEAEMTTVMKVIRSIRNLRAELKLPPKQPVPVMVVVASPHSEQLLAREQAHITNLARVGALSFLAPDAPKPLNLLSAVVPDVSSGTDVGVFVSTEGLIDAERERERLEKEIAQTRSRVDQTRQRLQNSSFVERAPANVVQKEQNKVAELDERLRKLEDRLESVR